MDVENRRVDTLRNQSSDLQSHLIDELLAGRLTRREFLRRGSVLGMSLPLLASVAAGCGGSSNASSSTASGSTGTPGATIRVGIIVPTADINPLTVADQGGQDMLAQTGEYLCLSDPDLNLRPVLAEKWSSDATGSVWTFQLRRGVRFHDGKPLTADDVVYTYKLQSDSKSASNALSNFVGVLVPDGVRKIDDYTVAFHLEAPNGNFPYLTSSDNYNMIILPSGYDPAKWQASFVGSGPFVLKRYTPKVGASFVRNTNYWGTAALPSETLFTFYPSVQPQILALESGSIDVIGQFAVQGGESLLNNPNVTVINLKSSAHRELSMRCDTPPFTDARVRQAIALTLDRPGIVQGLFHGQAQVGNDSPFAPVFPSTNKTVPQRVQDLAKAKQLLAAAGYPNGLSTTMRTEQFLEIPDFAQIIKAQAGKIGVNIALDIESQSQYFGKAVFGQSDWLDATMSLVEYGHRSVPNVFLTAPLESNGTWNAARFKNPTYDHLVEQYVAAVDLQTQRDIAGSIERLLLEETPVIFAYFYNYLTATAKSVTGVLPTAIGHIFLYNAAKN